MLRRAVVLVVASIGATLSVASVGAPRAAAADCAASTSAADLDAFFASDDAAGLAGADYPHAYALPDGRRLWLFQDAFFGADDELQGDRFAHNAALVQDGSCFEVLPTSGGDGTSWIGSWVETSLTHWFWPLDAEVGADGALWLFLAEVRSPDGDGAAPGARPVATWRARYRLPDLQLLDLEPAADPNAGLFGYSIVSDNQWTYLYGHCYRQFLTGAEGEPDPSCVEQAYVARVPKGELDHTPEYWSGTIWTRDRDERQAVLTSDITMPMSVERFGDAYVAASDEGDWFGADVVIRTAPAPQGPWTEVARYTPAPKCDDCNNYGAFVMPWLEGDQVVIAQSNNAWDMRVDAFPDASLYRIGLRALAVPGIPGAPLPPPPRPADVLPGLDVPDVASGGDDAAVEGRRTVAPPVAVEVVAGPHASTTIEGSPRWSVTLLVALRVIGLGLAAVVVAAATTGFASNARRVGPARRQRALHRVRTSGPVRAHGLRAGVPEPPGDVPVGAGQGGADR